MKYSINWPEPCPALTREHQALYQSPPFQLEPPKVPAGQGAGNASACPGKLLAPTWDSRADGQVAQEIRPSQSLGCSHLGPKLLPYNKDRAPAVSLWQYRRCPGEQLAPGRASSLHFRSLPPTVMTRGIRKRCSFQSVGLRAASKAL